MNTTPEIDAFLLQVIRQHAGGAEAKAAALLWRLSHNEDPCLTEIAAAGRVLQHVEETPDRWTFVSGEPDLVGPLLDEPDRFDGRDVNDQQWRP